MAYQVNQNGELVFVPDTQGVFNTQPAGSNTPYLGTDFQNVQNNANTGIINKSLAGTANVGYNPAGYAPSTLSNGTGAGTYIPGVSPAANPSLATGSPAVGLQPNFTNAPLIDPAQQVDLTGSGDLTFAEGAGLGLGAANIGLGLASYEQNRLANKANIKALKADTRMKQAELDARQGSRASLAKALA